MMMAIRALLIVFFLSIPIDQAWGQARGASEPVAYSSGVMVGFFGGTGAQINGRVHNFASGFPFGARFGVGYTKVAAGDAKDSRRIFVNNATNGVPESHGWQWDYRLDLLYPVDVFHLQHAYVFGGPRYAKFTGNFKFVGGNEDFEVVSKTWGFGGGLESSFGVSPVLDLVVSTGIDIYPSATLSGHDTSYNPSGNDVNPREDYDYGDADHAINQPKYELRLMLGLQYNY
jgi:hypothetical protein